MDTIRHTSSKGLIAFVILVSSILLWASCNEEYQYSHGSIYGTIIDANTKRPVEVACNVKVINQDGEIVVEQTTDAKGSYKTKDISEGSYTLSVEAEDYYSGDSRTVQVKRGETTQCDITLGRLPAKITADVEEVDFGESESLSFKSFKIVNRYLDDLEWVVEHDCEWILSIEPNKGVLGHGKTETINITITRAKLKSGENKTNIIVKSPKGQGGVNIIVKAIGEEKEAPVLNVTGVESVDRTSAVLNGEIIKPGVPAYYRRGFTCSTKSMDDNAAELQVEFNDNTTFSYSISGLTAGKKYYVRAYAVNASAGKVWSANEFAFTTIESYAKVRTDNVTELSLTNGNCTLNGFIESSGTPAYSERGFCVSDSGDPTIDQTKYSVSGSGQGAYSFSLFGLTSNQTYRYRAYVIQSGRPIYGDVLTFDMSSETTQVSTSSATDLTASSATLHGSILKVGRPTYSEKGFCIAEGYNSPTINDRKITVNGTSSGDYSAIVSGLSYNKSYHFCAYAIQNGSPVYGQVLSFQPVFKQASVETSDATISGYFELTFNGSVRDIGDPPITERGFCYVLYYGLDPRITDSKVNVSGISTGDYSAKVANLSEDAKYAVRAYVIQDNKAYYGSSRIVTTALRPSITTHEVTGLSVSSDGFFWQATMQGSFVDGVPNVTDYGFVYGEYTDPTLSSGTVIQPGSSSRFVDTCDYSRSLNNLMPSKTYYYRAYVKTSLGTFYGSTISFRTY